MKPEHRSLICKGRETARSRVHGSTGQQLHLLVLPTIAALVVGWRTFVAPGDLPLSAVLGCTVFATMTPLLAMMSERGLKRTGENK